MIEVDKDVLLGLFPRPLDEFESARLDGLIESAVKTIDTAFLRQGRNFEQELKTVPWLEPTAQEVVADMVAAAVLVGPNVGLTNASSSTGQESDAATFRDTLRWTSWRGVRLTDDMAALLGLSVAARASVRSPGPIRWPERRLFRRW